MAKRPVPKPPWPKPGWPKRPLPWPKMKVKVEPGVEVKVEPKVEVVEPKPMPKPKKPLPKPLPQRTPKDGHNIKDLVLAVHKDKNPAQLADPGFIDDSLAEYKDHEREVYFAVCEQYQVTPVLRREPGDWDYKAPMLHPPPPPTRPVPPHPDDLLARYNLLVRPKSSDVDVSEDNEQSGATKRQKMDKSDDLDDGHTPGPPPTERPAKPCATANCLNRSAWECSTGCCAAHCNDAGCPRHSGNYSLWLRRQSRWERANRRRGGVKTTSLKNLRSVD